MNNLLKKFRSSPVRSDVVGLQDNQLSGWFDSETGQLAEGFVITPDDTVIDVGCGDGGYANFAAHQGAEVIATDVVEENVAKTLNKLKKSQARSFEAHVSDTNPLPIDADRCSRVICMEVLEHVPDPQQFISELVRVGEPGALYLLAVPDPASEAIQQKLAPPCYWEMPNHLRVFERDQFSKLVTDSGLQIEKQIYKGFFWSVWWALFWVSGQELGDADGPILSSWAKTWNELLKSDQAERVKETMDFLMPKSQVILARKPE